MDKRGQLLKAIAEQTSKAQSYYDGGNEAMSGYYITRARACRNTLDTLERRNFQPVRWSQARLDALN